MARPKKKSRDLTDKELLKKLFPKEVRDDAKKTAQESRKKPSRD